MDLIFSCHTKDSSVLMELKAGRERMQRITAAGVDMIFNMGWHSAGRMLRLQWNKIRGRWGGEEQ